MYLDTTVISLLERLGAALVVPDPEQPHISIARIGDKSVLLYSLPTGLVASAGNRRFRKIEDIVDYISG